MKITVAKLEDVSFYSLASGDVFKYGNYFCMKLVEQGVTITDDNDFEYDVTAINLDTAELVYVSMGERVIPYSAELILTTKNS